MANKMTHKDYFNAIIALAEEAGRNDIVDFAQGRIEALNKKSSNKKATKNQEANEAIKVVIADTLASIGSGTVTDLQGASEELAGYSNQKISALLRQMVNDGKVAKSTEGKKSVFSLAEGV